MTFSVTLVTGGSFGRALLSWWRSRPHHRHCGFCGFAVPWLPLIVGVCAAPFCVGARLTSSKTMGSFLVPRPNCNCCSFTASFCLTTFLVFSNVRSGSSWRCIGTRVPFSREYGDPGSPFWGSPFSHDTGSPRRYWWRSRHRRPPLPSSIAACSLGVAHLRFRVLKRFETAQSGASTSATHRGSES